MIAFCLFWVGVVIVLCISVPLIIWFVKELVNNKFSFDYIKICDNGANIIIIFFSY